MSGPNHVIGGTVFTGLYLSMWDVNIYQNPLLLFFTAFFALLPDIDHTKSIIGKTFYPIAKILDKKFGHRTITHSLAVYISLGILIGILEQTWFKSTLFTKVYYWAYGSHLLLDMITLQGIPLFYPFKKNPCVIPGNPNMRFRSSDLKAEMVMFLIFASTAFLSKDLFANGFWNTYDSSFGTIKHLNNERNLTSKSILVSFNIIANNQAIKGQGILINSTPSTATVFQPNKGFLDISDNDKIITLIPKRSHTIIQTKELQFANISTDSLNKLVLNKPIINLKLQSALPLSYSLNKLVQVSNQVNLSNALNPVFSCKTSDSTDLGIEKEIQLLKLEMAFNTQIQNDFETQKTFKLQKLETANLKRLSQNLSDKEEGIRTYQSAKQDYESMTKPYDKSNELNLKLKYLNQKLHIHKAQSINGFITFLTFSK
jgi:inner membrane protein